MQIDVQHNLSDLNAILPLYQLLRGVTDREVLAKQGGKLEFALYSQLRDARRAKGAIRAELLARLASGRTFRVRDSVRQSVSEKLAKKPGRLPLQAEMFRREIAVRESGRGVMAISARYPRDLAPGQRAVSRYGPAFSQSIFNLAADHKEAGVLWGGLSKQSARAVQGLKSPVGRRAIGMAVAVTRKDIEAYIGPKLKRDALRALAAGIK